MELNPRNGLSRYDDSISREIKKTKNYGNLNSEKKY